MLCSFAFTSYSLKTLYVLRMAKDLKGGFVNPWFNHGTKSTKLDAYPILTSNTKCPFKSKPLLLVSNNKVRVKVSVSFSLL